MSTTPHIPVLCHDVLSLLDIQPTDIILDGTLGFGGHSEAMLALLGPKGKLYGIDQDPEAIAYCENKFKGDKRVHISHGNFSKFSTLLPTIKFTKVLVDLGFSSYQLDSASRGFSHQSDDPLDMRMDLTTALTAAKILNNHTATELSDIFFTFGELFHNKRLVELICTMRKKEPFKTTDQLIYAIKHSYSFNDSRSLFMKIQSQVFQALRIATNKEWEHLSNFLESLPNSLESGGHFAIISFHSGEDRIVKHTLKKNTQLKQLTKHVVTASQEEIRQNSRSKPAKLRVYRKS